MADVILRRSSSTIFDLKNSLYILALNRITASSSASMTSLSSSTTARRSWLTAQSQTKPQWSFVAKTLAPA